MITAGEFVPFPNAPPWWRRLAWWFVYLGRLVWRSDSWAPAWGIDTPPVVLWLDTDDYFEKRDEILQVMRDSHQRPHLIVPDGVRVTFLQANPPMLGLTF